MSLNPNPNRAREGLHGLHARVAILNSQQADADRGLNDLELAVNQFIALPADADLSEVRALRARYIMKKQTARALVSLLPAPEHVRESRVAALITRFRAADNLRRSSGAIGLGGGERSLPRSAHILDYASATNLHTKASLKDGLSHVNIALQTARETAFDLSLQRDKMLKIGTALDETSSELSLSVRQIKRYGKQLSTDRIFLVLLCIFLCVAISLGVYIGLDPEGAARAFRSPLNLSAPTPNSGGGGAGGGTGGNGGGKIAAGPPPVDPMQDLRQFRAPPVRGSQP